MGDPNHAHDQTFMPARRRFLAGGLAVAATCVAGPVLAALPTEPARQLNLLNLHTGEALKTAYWANGKYIPGGQWALAKVLRDHRSGEVHAMAPGLFDLLHRLQGALETSSPFHIISGYRSPRSNAKLAAESTGVAKRSLHMDGKALDIRIPGVDLANLHKAAKSLGVGGVGYYPESNFVHVDVGRVRYW